MFCLVGDYAIAENFIMANRVLIDAAAIAGVALDGVDDKAVFSSSFVILLPPSFMFLG